jgi:2-oxoacid:acceptor oxidoreductase gamma subunit (pyruvate/2-ketoisovalerate family)
VTQREILFTGVGGQGVQIASKALAMAAIADGFEVLLLPRYGGGMRGGMTNATLTVGDGALRALPVVTSAWAGFVMDPAYWETIRPNLAEGAVVVVNSSGFELLVEIPEARVFPVPAKDIAVEMGIPMSAGFVMLGAFVAVTGVVEVESTIGAMRQLVPPYRTEHVEANERAIRAGVEALPWRGAPAWPGLEVA